MQYSPPIPFVDATQNNVAHPNALKPGSEFVRLTMYTGVNDPVPTWPWPTYTWGIADQVGTTTLHGASPLVGSVIFHPFGSLVPNCADWFQLGAYLVGVAPTYGMASGQLSGPNVIVWPAPGPIAPIAATYYPSPYYYSLTTAASPSQWDISWMITTHLYPGGFTWNSTLPGWVPADPADPVNLVNTYYTGAGSETLAGVTTLHYAVVSGRTAVLFDDTGIGLISYTGDWNIPFDYSRRIDNYATCGWPINVNGWVYFVDVGGKMFRTDGSYAIEVGGGYFPGVQKSTALFNVKTIPEMNSATDSTSHALITWPASLADAENWMQFDGENHRLVVNIRYKDVTAKSAGLAMVEMNSGTFQFLPDATNLTNGADLALPRVETGGIPLTEPAQRTHVAYVDVDFEILGTPSSTTLTVGATEAFSGTMVDGPPSTVAASGRQTVRCWVNQLVDKVPRFRITLNNPPAGVKCRIWGIQRIAFMQGGQLP